MSSDFSIEKISQKENVALVRFGEQLLGGNDNLKFITKLNEFPTRNIKYVIADLSEVELINSSGLGMLVSGLTTLKKYEIEFLLCCLPEKVINLLEMTHLNRIFKIFDNPESAISSLE